MKRITSTVLLVVVVVGVAVALARVNQNSAPPERAVVQLDKQGASGPLTGSGETPTPWTSGSAIMNRAFDSPMTVDQSTMAANVIADVTVAFIGQPLFDTDSGAFPTRSPDDDDSGLAIGATVDLRMDAFRKGQDPDVVGFVVWEWGGERDGLIRDALPPEVFPIGSEGVAFLRVLNAEQLANAAGRWKHMKDRATELSSPGALFVAAEVVNFYQHDGDQMVIPLAGNGIPNLWTSDTMNESEFYDELDAALLLWP